MARLIERIKINNMIGWPILDVNSRARRYSLFIKKSFLVKFAPIIASLPRMARSRG